MIAGAVLVASLMVPMAPGSGAVPADPMTAGPVVRAAGLRPAVAPCRFDDGSGPSPCVWDARHSGNGAGRSFVARRDGRVVYVTHRRAHILRFGGAS